ncbi:hypothetical protein J3Q64DRAFT_1833365 [Phycomyces blakesleeanus]|uniref:Uncharacterized protein n=1 Tax=Phycomyces blakesleeanus TaxID=4837 RepID=A0ABR3B0A7_PHYBL
MMNNNRRTTATVTTTPTSTTPTSTTRKTTPWITGPRHLSCSEIISVRDEVRDLINAADKDPKGISTSTIRRRHTQLVENHRARQRQGRRMTGAYKKFPVLEQLLTNLMEIRKDGFAFAEVEREKEKECETFRRLQKENVVKDRATMFRIMAADINSARKRQKTTSTAPAVLAPIVPASVISVFSSGPSPFAGLVPSPRVAPVTSTSKHAVATTPIAIDHVERIIHTFNKKLFALLEKVEDDEVFGAIERLETKVDNEIMVIYNEIQTVNKQIEMMEKNMSDKINMQSQLIQALLRQLSQ